MSRWASLIANDNVYKEILRGYHERERREEDIHEQRFIEAEQEFEKTLAISFLNENLF